MRCLYPVVEFAITLILFLAVIPGSARAETVNLLSLQEGCLPLLVPENYGGWDAHNLLDDSPASGWASATGKVADNVFVFEMIGEAMIESFEFDTAGVDTKGSAAKDIVVEISAQSATAGFAPVLRTSLADITNGQKFKAEKAVSGRWVRLTIVNNHGSGEYTEMFSFRGHGEAPKTENFADISGTYATDYANFHVRRQGTALTGCYEYNDGLLTGAIDGRLMKITWQEGPDNTGPAVMVFSRDGQSFKGFWWHGDAKGEPSGVWNGTRTGKTVGSCPHWSGSIGGELHKQLQETGRARIYGIRFALDSADIEPESTPILAEIVTMLQADAALQLSIEGHTDATGSPEHNQQLSEQRAAAVKAYLVGQGIAAGRLATAGFGPNQPVADNDSELGRARNRRVELVRR